MLLEHLPLRGKGKKSMAGRSGSSARGRYSPGMPRPRADWLAAVTTGAQIALRLPLRKQLTSVLRHFASTPGSMPCRASLAIHISGENLRRVRLAVPPAWTPCSMRSGSNQRHDRQPAALR